MSVGEKGEKVRLTGDESGTIVDDRGGDIGRWGGGVTDIGLGVPGPEDNGEAPGEESRGE